MDQQSPDNGPCPEHKNSPYQRANDGAVDLACRFADVDDTRNRSLDKNGIPVTKRIPEAELHKPAKVCFPADVEEQIRQGVAEEY